MSAAIYYSVDPVKEFRLRRWARENYVAPSQRRDTWHSVVLDEMNQRDLEREIEMFQPPAPHAAFVPLEPTDIRYLHGPHSLPEEPNILQTKKPVEFYIHG